MLEQDIQESIKKHLPEQTAGALKERLDELEKKENLLGDYKKLNETLTQRNNELRNEVGKLKEELSSHQVLDEKRRAIIREEELLEKDKWKFEVQKEAYMANVNAHKLVADQMMEFTRLVVGHPSVTVENTRQKYVNGGQRMETRYNYNTSQTEEVPANNPDVLVTETDTTVTKKVKD